MSAKSYPTINVVNAAKAWFRSVEKQRIEAGDDGKIDKLPREDKRLYLAMRALMRAEKRLKVKAATKKPAKVRDYN